VNNRYIRSNYLNHAVSNAFEGLIQDGNFPFYVLFVEIDPRHIDVNVHPTKTEIKFDDERSVYAVMSAAIRQALGAHNLTPAIDFSSDVNMAIKLDAGRSVTKEQYFDEQFSTLGRSNLENWEKIFDKDSPVQSRLINVPADQQSVLYESRLNTEIKPSVEKISFQLLDRYLVKALSTGLVIIDQSAAHERVLYERFVRQLATEDGSSQQSLFPQTVTLHAADFAMAMEMGQELKALGFQFEIFGKNALLINGIPSGLKGSEKEIFEGLIEQFKMNQSRLQVPIRENLARALAKRAAIQPGKKLAREEIESVIGGLFACSNPNFSPEGKPTFFTFDASKLEGFFS
jgi:DNA mismatch repair protein MutL